MQIQQNFRKEQWKMLFITMFCYLFFYTGRHNFGWAAKGMSVELGISYQQIGWISFSMLMGYAIGQLINGNLADRLSPKIMILTGGSLSIICNLFISYANTYGVILVLWTLNGYFQSMAWGSGSKLISNWWDSNERGKAFGFYTMAAGSSSVLTFFMALLLLQQEQSWRTLQVSDSLSALRFNPILIIARSHPALKGFILQSDHVLDQNTQKLGWKESYKEVFRNKNFITASCAIGFQSMARYGLIFGYRSIF
ncbi:MFS transporter [Sphingobacterium sp. KU25419]|nr:MFS transporter [Sphingobacterium sp. KU25419]